MIFVMANSGNLYRIYQNRLELIFANHSKENLVNLLYSFRDISPVLFFGIGNKQYALKADGTKLTHFPGYCSESNFSPRNSLCTKNGSAEILFYPLAENGCLAIDKMVE